ncbi:hypothetical protein ACHAWF_010959 [Thalassiosira exigua]
MSAAREDYVRVKRRNQTFFVPTSPSDTFARVKEEVSLAMGGEDVVSPRSMRLYVAPKKTATTTTKADNDDDSDDDAGEEKKKKAAAAPEGPVPDAATLSDRGVTNDGVLFATFAKGWEGGGGGEAPSGDDDWEEIEVSDA